MTSKENTHVSYKEVDSSNISQQEMMMLRDQIWRMRHPDQETREQLWPENVTPKVVDLKGIATQRIYEWESDTTWFRAYEVELHQFTGFQYVLDFKGTTNHEIQGTFGCQGLRVEANLQPFELETICLVSRNKLDPFKFAVKMQWITTDVHPAILETALAMNQNRIRNEYDLMTKAGVRKDDELKDIRSILLSNGLKFVDEDFYPCPQSLYIDGEKSPKLAEEQAMWRRASDFCKNPQVFEGGIEPSDVQQGRLGNCWFCCSLASMAERPKLITKLFVTQKTSPDGSYEVRFCHNGLWKVVLLDDFIPCKPYKGPIYTKTGEDELWVALLEKAYAKIYGCYERLIAGSPYHALPDLTGNPATIYELHDPDDTNGLWDKLLSWNLSENNMMSAACDETSKHDPVEAGLLPDHSYTILDAKEGLDPLVRLVCIRNPWGHGEWQGDWSDFSPLWTEKAKAIFNPSNDPEDGTFWMCYEDFLDYFTSLTVCFCRRDWIDARIGADLSYSFDNYDLTTPVIRLIVPDGGKLEWIGIFQQDEREQGAPGYLDLCVFIMKESNNGREPIGFIGMESARQAFVAFGPDSNKYKNALGGGSYLLVPFTSGRHWDEDTGPSRGIALSAHAHSSKSKLGMKIIGAYGREEIDQVLLEFTMKLGEEKKWRDLERRHLRIGQMDIYAGVNRSKDKVLTFSMKGDLDNIYNALGYPDLSQGCAFDIDPQQSAIFGVQVMENPKDAGSSAYKFGLKVRNYS